jgi:hypothetical protein
MTTRPAEVTNFFVDTQRELLRTILNRIIPESGAFPGAGDLSAVSYLDAVVGRSVELRQLFAHGLTQIEIASQELYAETFRSLSDHMKDVVLHCVEAQHSEFFSALVTHTYSGYYSDTRILRLLDRDVRPPQPQGYELEPLDLGLLDRVGQQKPKYRPA